MIKNFLNKINIKVIIFACFLFLTTVLVFAYFLTKNSSTNQPLPSLNPNLKTKIPSQSKAQEDFSRLDKEIKIEKVDPPSIGNELKSIYQQNPWLEQLPLRTKRYVILYDWELKSIRIRIIVDASSSISYDNQIKSIKEEALKNLQKIGVDINKVPFYYVVSPFN